MLDDVTLLAQSAMSGYYVSPIKLGATVLWFAVWALFAAWVDKDTLVVNTFRILWNLIVLSSGFVAAVLGLILPEFYFAFPAFVLVNMVVMIVYVVHRNGLVEPNERVMTAEHFKRIQTEGFTGKKKKKLKDVKERVRLIGHNRKVVAIPEEEAEREMYRLTQDLMFDFFWRRGSVLTITPATAEAAKVTYLVDGQPMERDALPRADADAVITFLKKIAGLNLEEKRKPQTGTITTQLGEAKTGVTVRSDGSTAGEKLTLKVIGAEAKFKIPEIGLTPDQQTTMTQLIKEVEGKLILLSGPRFSGVSTTLYSIVRSHDAYLQNIQLIEYTKEVTVENITQHLFVPADDKTFAQEVVKLVRSDPDLIVVPEIRDREAAIGLSKAGATKQRCYTTIPALDVFDALNKWLTLVNDRAMVGQSLLAVTNQRLVRKLCTQCRTAYKPDAEMLKKLNMPADKVLYRVPEPQYDKHGNPIICQACQGSGFNGLTAVLDILLIDDAMRDMIRRNNTIDEIRDYAKSKGWSGLMIQGLYKVLEGVTSIQELQRGMKGDASSPPPAGGAKPATAPKPRPRPASPTA